MNKHRLSAAVLALLLFVCLAISALAVDGSQSFLYTLQTEGSGSVSTAVGEEFTVTVILSRTDAAEEWAMYAWQTEVAFDPTAFELVEDSVTPASGIGSSIHPGARETRVFFNAFSYSKSGSAYPASLEVGSFRLRAKWGGEYTVHNENYLVSTAGGADRYECRSSDLTVSVAGEMPIDRFTDVSRDDWFADAVNFAVRRGLFQGVSDTEFAPNMNMTRAMLVTVLHRLEGNPAPAAPSGFEDVPADDWYTEAVAWARERGVVQGYSDTQFGPNDSITREQMAAILFRYAKNKGYDVSMRADLTAYEDGVSVSSWAHEAMSWANAAGLIRGRTETTLNPVATATRAEVATILMRFCGLIEKGA